MKRVRSNCKGKCGLHDGLHYPMEIQLPETMKSCRLFLAAGHLYSVV